MPDELIFPNEQSLSRDGLSSQNPALVYLVSLKSDHSRRNLFRYLNQVAGLLSKGQQDAFSLDWTQVGYSQVVMIRTRLSETYAPATVNGMLSAIRGVLRTAWKLGQMSGEDYQRAIDVPNVKGTRLPAGRDLHYREIRALLAVCGVDEADQLLKGKRDAAVIGVLYATGMRRSEVAELLLDDYDASSGRLAVRSGKGDKDRTVYVKNRPKQFLDSWLEARGSHEGPLFHPVNKGGRMDTEQGISAQAIYSLLKRRADDAGIADFSPHDLRRTFVGDALDAGIDLVTVAEIAGHASTDTTRKYDRRGERAKEQAASKLDF